MNIPFTSCGHGAKVRSILDSAPSFAFPFLWSDTFSNTALQFTRSRLKVIRLVCLRKYLTHAETYKIIDGGVYVAALLTDTERSNLSNPFNISREFENYLLESLSGLCSVSDNCLREL